MATDSQLLEGVGPVDSVGPKVTEPRSNHYLRLSKEIYKQRKQPFIEETLRRSELFTDQLIDPEEVKAEFRLLVGDLAYRLSAYRKTLDLEEQILKSAPYELQSKLERELLQFYGDRIVAEINRYATEMEPICEYLEPEEHFAHKTYFQEHLLEFVTLCSAFSARAYYKPNGYAGDYQMVKMLCDDDVYRGDTLFEKCVNRFSVTSPSGRPVRNRTKVIFDLIDVKVDETLARKERVRIFDLVSGPSLYLQQYLALKPASSKLTLSFVDQDKEAIAALQRDLSGLKENHRRSTTCHFYGQPVQALFSDPEVLSQLADQDLIVSSGLFDYLDDDVAAVLINVLYTLLAPGGTLVIGNLCPAETTKIFQWYVNEWPLNFRTHEELRALAPAEANSEIVQEELGFNLFLKVEKS